MSVFRIEKNVNPHFKSVWESKVPYNVLKGGRNSFKSSVVALKLVKEMSKQLNKNKQELKGEINNGKTNMD